MWVLNYLPVALLAMLPTLEEMRMSLLRIWSTVRHGPHAAGGALGDWMPPLFSWKTQSLVRSVDSPGEAASFLSSNT